jgi:diguanylate cyclase (GGDEF)-like protein
MNDLAIVNQAPRAALEPVGLTRAVELTSRYLELDAAFIAQLTDAGHVYAAVAGDADVFGLSVGDAIPTVNDNGLAELRGPVQQTAFCRLLLAGEIPAVVGDAAADERLADLIVPPGVSIGAFIGVPLRLPDGEPFGALCGLSRTPRLDLDERDARFMSMLGEVIVDELGTRDAQQRLASELVRIIDSEDVEIAFQPIIDLHGRRCAGLEALARFPEPLTPPNHTLAAAEGLGLRLELERLVIRKAWKIIPELGPGQFLALNVAPEALLELARRANLREDLPLSRLVVEVTEHAVIDLYPPLIDELAPLRAQGLRVAVDDAGAGYASLRHVLELRPDFIKVDRSLIHGIADDRAKRAAVRACQSIALDLRASVIAEGVERPQDLAVAIELGLQAAQGYLLGTPTTDMGALARWIGSRQHREISSLPVGPASHADLVPAPETDQPVPASAASNDLPRDTHEMSSAWRRDHAGSGLTSRLIFAYVEREAGGHAVQELLERAGLEAAERELRDENCWFSYETKLALWGAAEEVLGDPDVAEHAGEAALDLSVAMGLKRALRALGTPAFVYGNVARANAKFNWAHELVVIDSGRESVRMRYKDISGVGYHRHDCRYTKGLLATVPQLFGLPQAHVEHTLCGARGDRWCEFDVSWTSGLHGVRRAAIALAGGAALLAAGGAMQPELLPIGGGLLVAGEAALAAKAMRFTRRRTRVLEQRVREQDDAAERLMSSLQNLSSDLRLDEVLEQITAKAQTAVGGKEFALLIDDGDRISANRHSGIPSAALTALETWANARRGALRDRGTVLIDDLTAEPALAELPQLQRMPLGSLCAAPLVFGDQLLGLLVALAHGSTVFLPSDASTLSAYAGHAAIALSNARLVERLERQAAEDPLTGLANQRAFRSECEREFSRIGRTGGEVSLVLLDLDHFKAINDEHGHPYGDQVLIAVADALRASVRVHDTVARLGGEEFAILLPDADADAALEFAERARRAIGRIPVARTPLACSAGAATATSTGTSPRGLLERADRALYEAKRLGRNRTAISPIDGAGSSTASASSRVSS